jgi:alkylated DNA repair dioxygenase AlkB
MQTNLFGAPLSNRQFVLKNASDVKDLEIYFDFINPAEESRLIEEIDRYPWILDLSRRVQHYGYKYDYKARRLDNSYYLGALPSWQIDLAERMKDFGVIDFFPDQAIINEYEPGQGIAPHIDCEPCFGDTIISISLGSPCVMNFERAPNSRQKVEVLLEPRSLVVMKEESRFQWYHGIPPRKTDKFNGQIFQRKRRISITFRKVIL